MKLSALISFFFLFALPILGNTIYVPDDQPTINAAIGASTHGDSIIVRPGIYFENIDFGGKNVTVQSLHGHHCTTIDGTQTTSAVRFASGEDAGALLEGFTITNGAGTPSGGGVFCRGASPTLRGNLIVENRAVHGGGIYVENGLPLMVNNLVIGNEADLSGGGIACDIGGDTTLTNCTLSANSAGAEGGGLVCRNSAAPALFNTILWSNSAPLGAEIFTDQADPSLSHCNVAGGWPGTNNIDADPLFVKAEHHDFHLTFQSPCGNGGDPAAPGLPSADFEGDPRNIWGGVDIGADEFFYHLYQIGPMTPGSTSTIRVIGWPHNKRAPVLLALGSAIADPPTPTPWGDLFLTQPFVYLGEIGYLRPTGSLIKPFTVPIQWNAGEEKPFQALVGHSYWSSSPLTNLLVLKVE